MRKLKVLFLLAIVFSYGLCFLEEKSTSHYGIDETIIKLAIEGKNKLASHYSDSNILSIVDFSQPSTAKRLYVINLKDSSLIFNTFVAHGKGTGNNWAKKFSNIPNSHQSSLGFYKTLSTYSGKHGYSLKLEGLEKGVNDKAQSRAIVMHGASYVSKDFITKYGRLGRSFGCPSVPESISKSIIDFIKEGTCIFIYAPDSTYLNASEVLN